MFTAQKISWEPDEENFQRAKENGIISSVEPPQKKGRGKRLCTIKDLTGKLMSLVEDPSWQPSSRSKAVVKTDGGQRGDCHDLSAVSREQTFPALARERGDFALLSGTWGVGMKLRQQRACPQSFTVPATADELMPTDASI